MKTKMLIKCLLAAAAIAAVFPASVNGDTVQFAPGSGGDMVLTHVGPLGTGDAVGTMFTAEPQLLPMLIAGTPGLIGWRGVHICK